MPQFNRRELDERSRQYGFNRDTFEKVLRLKIILEYFNSQDYLKEHLLLKGGTAINLTIFNLPRLSVDIDLDFVPNLPREETMSAREAVSDIIRRYMSEQGYSLSEASRFSHSLDAFHYNYTNAAGNRDMIKIEINYSLRTHVFQAEERCLLTDAFGEPVSVNTVAVAEIFAAKANALMSRAAARDLYDFCNMVDQNTISGKEDLFRKCTVFYATISAKEVNRTFDAVAIDKLSFSRIRTDLFPVLGVNKKFALEEKKLQAKEFIAAVMMLQDGEKEYMDRFISKEYRPELLFGDYEIVERIKNHPMALWKCR